MKNFNKIENYLNGNMSEEDLRLFKFQIAADKELGEEVALQRLEQEVILLASEDDLRDRIKIIQNSPIERNTIAPTLKVASKNRWLLPLSIAASVLLLIGFFFQKNQYTNEKLIDSYYNYNIDALRNTENISSVFSSATNAYEKENYMVAIEELKQLTDDPNYTIKANYLIGHSYFQLQDYQKAGDYFKTVFSNKEKAAIYYKDAQWYWLLSELAQGRESEEFDTILDQLAKEDSDYVGAKELRKDLNGVWR